MGVLSRAFPPLTARSFLGHYLPISGAVSHSLFAVHIFNPGFVTRLFPIGDLAVSNTILFNANLGLGFYVYFRHHLHRLNPWDRVEFSVFSSTMFNFGSLLSAVLLKALLPNSTPAWAKTILAVSLSGYLLSRAKKYLRYVDERSARGSPSPRSPRSVASGMEKHHQHHQRTPPPTTTDLMRNGPSANGTTPTTNGNGVAH